MFESPGRPRPHYRALHRRLLGLSADEFRRRKAMTDLSMRQDGVGFTVYRHEEGIERVWPMDPIPRVVLVPGDHLGILDPPNVAELGQKARQLLGEK